MEQPSVGVETAIIVHGTFSEQAQWYRRGSDFCERLDDALSKAGSNVRCWSHFSSEQVADYRWSGENSEVARQTHSTSLSAYLTVLALSDDVTKIHLIAHSHGGNVVYRALSNMTFQSHFLHGKLASVTFLGTPFFLFESFENAFEMPKSLTAPMIKLVSGDLARVHGLNFGNVQCVYFKNDEAFQLLSHALLAKNRPELYVRLMSVSFVSVLNSSYPNFYRTAFSLSRHLAKYLAPPLRNTFSLMFGMTAPWRGISSINIYVEDEWAAFSKFRSSSSLASLARSSIFYGMLVLWTPYLLLITAIGLFDWLIMAPILYGVNVGKRWLQRKGFQVAAGSVLGKDNIFDKLKAVVREPPFVFEPTLVELDGEIETAASERSIQSFSNIVRRIYETPAPVFTSETDTQDYITNVRQIFTDPNFLHCQYYSDDAVIQHVVNGILKPPKMTTLKQALVESLAFPLGR